MDRSIEHQGVAFVWNTDQADRYLRQHGIRIISARKATPEEWKLYED
jgi:uncharacterized DUF497 family protein